MQNPKVSFLKSLARLSLILTSVLVAAGCGQQAEVDTEPVARPVKYFKINPGGRDASIEYSGKITAAQEVFMSFEVPGKITSFPVKEGERVKKGAQLARLDDRDFKTVLDSRMADLNAAKADYDRARDLYENNTISKRDLDVARRNYEVAQAGVRSAEKSLGDTRLITPFSGLVAKTLVENYQNIQAKQPVLILQDDSFLQMVVDIPERDYSRVDRNISLSELTRMLKPEILVTSFPDQRFKARFNEAAATADEVTRTFELTLGFQAPPNISILPGMTARLIITGSIQKNGAVVMIPAKAVLADDKNQPTVWLINTGTNTVKQHPVEIGEMSGETIEVISGLEAGNVIAASGVHQLREGMIVRRYEKP